MPFVLLAVFLRGPAWLKTLFLVSFAALLFVAVLAAANTFRTATERTAPAHVTHSHRTAARFVRS